MEPNAAMGNTNDSINYGFVPPIAHIENSNPPQAMPPPIILKLDTPIILSNAVLTPPSPRELITRCTKPDGCRTVVVRYLPEKITRDTIIEAFEKCGNIASIRMSGNNLCRITFEDMESVEHALLFSGYRIIIEGKNDPAYTAKLHVDYYITHDDQHNFESRMQEMGCKESHHTRTVDSLNPLSIPDYSEEEAASVKDKLSNSETFLDGLQVLYDWMKSGKCDERNNETFYSMLEIIHARAKILTDARAEYGEEVKKAREQLHLVNQSAEQDLSDIKKVYEAVEKQNWDNFSEDQKRDIEDWKKNAVAFSAIFNNSCVGKDRNVDLKKKNVKRCDKDLTDDELHQMREYETLKQQVASTQMELSKCKQTCNEYYEEYLRLKQALEEKQKVGDSAEVAAEGGSHSSNANQNVSVTDSSTQSIPDIDDSMEKEIVALVSVYLNIHPLGAKINFIHAHLLKVFPTITVWQVENLLRKFPGVFREVSTGIGATFEKKWKYVGFISSVLPSGR